MKPDLRDASTRIHDWLLEAALAEAAPPPLTHQVRDDLAALLGHTEDTVALRTMLRLHIATGTPPARFPSSSVTDDVWAENACARLRSELVTAAAASTLPMLTAQVFTDLLVLLDYVDALEAFRAQVHAIINAYFPDFEKMAHASRMRHGTENDAVMGIESLPATDTGPYL